MDPRQVPLSLWQRRGQLPSLPLPGTIAAMTVLCLVLSLASQCGILALLPAAVAGAILSALLLLHRTPLVLLSPLCAAGAVLVFARDVVSAAAALTAIPFGFAAAAAVYGEKSRLTASVCCGAAGGLCLALPCALCLIVKKMTFSHTVQSLRTAFCAMLTALTMPIPGGRELPVFSPEAAQTLTDILTPLSPALLLSCFLLLGAAVCAILRLILTVLGAQSDFLPDGWRMAAGRACAAVYCGAQLLLLLAVTTPDAEPLYYAAYNVSLLFMLPLALTGFGALLGLWGTLRKAGSMTKAAVAVLFLMLFAAGLYWLCTAAAFYGVYLAFRRCRSGEEDS